jgi:hypothetical protein
MKIEHRKVELYLNNNHEILEYGNFVEIDVKTPHLLIGRVVEMKKDGVMLELLVTYLEILKLNIFIPNTFTSKDLFIVMGTSKPVVFYPWVSIKKIAKLIFDKNICLCNGVSEYLCRGVFDISKATVNFITKPEADRIYSNLDINPEIENPACAFNGVCPDYNIKNAKNGKYPYYHTPGYQKNDGTYNAGEYVESNVIDSIYELSDDDDDRYDSYSNPYDVTTNSAFICDFCGISLQGFEGLNFYKTKPLTVEYLRREHYERCHSADLNNVLDFKFIKFMKEKKQ